jgi:soluble lytic murein transglycosylase-like protein
MHFGLPKIGSKKIRQILLLLPLIVLASTVSVFARTKTNVKTERNLVARAVSPTPFRPSATPSPLPTSTPTPQPTAVPTAIPTAAPTVIPTSIPATSYEEHFDRYSGEYKVDKELLKKIANCESHTNPGSVNGDYGGMFQFASSTWTSTRASMGLDTNIDLRFNAEEAIKTAAFKIGNGGAGAWANCL